MSIFGTDGIRGKAGVFPVNHNTFVKIGIAISNIFSSHSKCVVVAKDTRVSSNELESSLILGLNYGGMEVISIGILPTSSLSFFVPKLGASVGIMISASHNQYSDNGLKFFAHDGIKLSKKYEKLIELHLERLSLGHGLGSCFVKEQFCYLNQAKSQYIDILSNTFLAHKNLRNIKIVLDVANGATTYIAEKLFNNLGATVFTYNNVPNGRNINNNCGAIYPENIKRQIIEHNADIGICLDGDGDRVVICDEMGNVIDGDQLIASLVLFFSEMTLLNNNKLVTTIMSSLALEKFLEQKGFKFIRSDVGEHNVIDKMEEHGCSFGAENSGHFIIKSYTNTSDGLITALQVLLLLVLKGIPISSLCDNFLLPIRLMKNICYEHEIDFRILEDIKNHFSTVKDISLIIRKSGTEKGVIRISAEGNNLMELNQIVDSIINDIYALQS